MIIEKVKEFHLAFDILVSNSAKLPTQPARDLRINLLQEEINELSEADEQNDLIEVADALADIAYIVCGTIISYGLGKDDHIPVFSNIHLNSLPKLPFGERVGIREANIEEINKIFTNYLTGENNSNLNEINDALYAMLESVYRAAFTYSIPLNDVFNEVHRSNMAKLMPDGSVLRRADNKVKKPPGWTPPDIKSILFPG